MNLGSVKKKEREEGAQGQAWAAVQGERKHDHWPVYCIQRKERLRPR